MNNRILFMGTPQFAVAPLNALIGAGLEIAAVVTAPDRPAGRGRQLRMSAVKQRALELGLPLLQPSNLKDQEFLLQLDALDASLYIVVAFRMLPREVWQKPKRGTVNLHASLLPNYRGAAPINWALINGEERTGLTTFLINDHIDTGDILLREVIHIAPDENAGQLHDRMMTIGAGLLVRTVKDLMDGTAQPLRQDAFVGDDRKEAPKLTPANCRINWAVNADHVHNLVRGLAPSPGAWTTWAQGIHSGQQLKVLATKVVSRHHRSHPGTVEFSNERMLIHCASGAVEVLELQLQGKRAMSCADFLNGLRDRTAARVE